MSDFEDKFRVDNMRAFQRLEKAAQEADKRWSEAVKNAFSATEAADVPNVVEEPPHYKHGVFEVIDEMILVFGPMRTYDFCIMNAWKYRNRALYKGNTEQDLDKANQYLKMAHQIMVANELGVPQVGLVRE